MAEWKKYLTHVLPEVMGCPVPLAERAVHEAAREFCERTWIWQETVDVETEKGEAEIFVQIPRGARLVAVRYLLCEGQKREPSDQLIIRSQRRSPVQSESPQGESSEFQARAVLKPAEDAGSGPDFLFNDHGEAIARGALNRLQLMAGKTWSNTQAALMNKALFDQAIAREKIRLAKGYTGRSLTVRHRRFA